MNCEEVAVVGCEELLWLQRHRIKGE